MAERAPSARPSLLSAFTARFAELDLADDLALDVRLDPATSRADIRLRAAAERVAAHLLVASGVRRISYVPYEALVIEEEYGEPFPFPRIAEFTDLPAPEAREEPRSPPLRHFRIFDLAGDLVIVATDLVRGAE